VDEASRGMILDYAWLIAIETLMHIIGLNMKVSQEYGLRIILKSKAEFVPQGLLYTNMKCSKCTHLGHICTKLLPLFLCVLRLKLQTPLPRAVGSTFSVMLRDSPQFDLKPKSPGAIKKTSNSNYQVEPFCPLT
jgi:hypothetical protein